MDLLINNKRFKKDFDCLKEVTLNPERHSAPNAYIHCKQVVERAKELAELNRLDSESAILIVNLAYVHDIGKIHGDARPASSVELLPQYGVTQQAMIDYVKYHDINLPWFIAHGKGQTPGEKAWRKLAGKIDMQLLCLFMIADRVDCPGGWQANEPLVWFISEARQRGLLTGELRSLP